MLARRHQRLYMGLRWLVFIKQLVCITIPVSSFYRINDFMLNTRKIGKFLPSQVRVKKDRAYTNEEIHWLLDIADERYRTIILLMASTGRRLGALPLLRMRNLEKLDNTYKITIYENDKEEYFTFCTPECTNSINSYLEIRKRYGENIDDNMHNKYLHNKDTMNIVLLIQNARV